MGYIVKISNQRFHKNYITSCNNIIENHNPQASHPFEPSDSLAKHSQDFLFPFGMEKHSMHLNQELPSIALPTPIL